MPPRRLPRITRRRLVWGLVLLALALAVALALRPRPVEVDVAVVERGPLEVTIDEEGETRVRERYVVSAPVAGEVLRVELEAGDRVEEGQTVAAIRPPRPQLLDVRSRAEAEAGVAAAAAAVEEARAQLDRAQAEASFAAAERDRARRLAAEGIVSRERLDEAETTARARAEVAAAARAATARARQELAAARARAAELPPRTAGAAPAVRVLAPVAGAVLRRLRESESVVAAGEPLLELGDPRDLEVVADLLSQDAVRIAPGDPVRIEEWGGEEPLAGRVGRVEPAGFTRVSALGVEEQRVDVVIELTDPAVAALGDAYRVEVRVVTWAGDDVLQVPTGALFRLPAGGWAVFVVRDGRARLRPVEIGHRSDLAAEVLAGLEDGEVVVIHPGDAVTDGARVEVRE